MKLKVLKISSVLASAVVALSAPNLFASLVGSGEITITAPGLSSGDADGPYSVKTISVSSGPNLGNFETFCLGSQVDYYSGGSYSYQISTQVQPFADGTSGGLAYITLGTAWLYSQYEAGALGDGSKNDSVNNSLQLAIWYLQGKQAGGQDNTFVTEAMNAINSLGGNYLANANGAWGVYAMDLSPTGNTGLAPGDAHGFAQPELCEVPGQPGYNAVPEPSTIFAGSLLLLPLGVSIIRILRKNRHGDLEPVPVVARRE